MASDRFAKVPMFRNVAKSVTVNLDATNGAQIGLNLLAPDGSLVKWTDILNVTTTPGTGTTETTTDDLDEGQFNLYFTTIRAQNAVGDILADSLNIKLTYVPGASITADLVAVGTLDTQALMWDTATDKWTPKIPAGGSSDLAMNWMLV